MWFSCLPAFIQKQNITTGQLIFLLFLLVANFALSVGVTVLSIIFILGYYLSGL